MPPLSAERGKLSYRPAPCLFDGRAAGCATGAALGRPLGLGASPAIYRLAALGKLDTVRHIAARALRTRARGTSKTNPDGSPSRVGQVRGHREE